MKRKIRRRAVRKALMREYKGDHVGAAAWMGRSRDADGSAKVAMKRRSGDFDGDTLSTISLNIQ